jgi:four helix bundle protein
VAGSGKVIESHRDLLVWQKSMDLAVLAYRLTVQFPADERYGMISQIRRSAASVPANIAEGYGRESPGAYAQHLRVAQGSLKEFETKLNFRKGSASCKRSRCSRQLDTPTKLEKCFAVSSGR